jgi:IS4 transposase
MVEKQFRIRLVLFDRGFSQDSKVLKIVEKHSLKYLAPKVKDRRIKKLIEGADRIRLFYHPAYIFGKKEVSTNLFFIPNGKHEKQIWENYHAFCTNIAVNESNIYFLAENYKRRWNIENFYRDVQGNFMIKTKTGDAKARLFFFLISAILYNLWYFVRGFVRIIAERWKDMLTDLLVNKRSLGYSKTYTEKNYGKIMKMLD